MGIDAKNKLKTQAKVRVKHEKFFTIFLLKLKFYPVSHLNNQFESFLKSTQKPINTHLLLPLLEYCA